METQRNGQARNFRCFRGEKTNPIGTAKHHSIILADDHSMVRRQIKKIIEKSPNLKVVGEAGDGFEVLDLLREFIPDLIILDISMPKCGGMEASREIKRLYPGLKIIILTMHRDEEYMQRAVGLGVDGYLLKENAADELIKAILTVRDGKTYFSPINSKYESYEPIGKIRLAWENRLLNLKCLEYVG